MVIKLNYKNAHYGFLLLITGMLFTNFFFSNDTLSLACTTILALYLVCTNVDNVLTSMIYFSFFSYLFVYNQYELYVFISIAFIIRAVLQNIKKVEMILLLIPLYLITHLLSTSFSQTSIGNYIPFFAIFTVPFACCIYKEGQKRVCLSYFLAGFFISSSLGFFKHFNRLNDMFSPDYISVSTWADTLRFSGLSFDANFYTLTVVFALIILLFEFGDKKSFAWVMLIIVTLIFGALTYSKSCILAFLAIFVLAIFSSEKSTKRIILKLIPIAVIAGIIFFNKIDTVFLGISERFSGITSLNDFSSDRYELWIQYLKVIPKTFESLMVGNGILERVGMEAAHNTYIEILYKFGILGFISDLILFTFSYKIFMINGKKSKNRFILVGIWTLFLIELFNLSAYTFYGLWVYILILFIISKDDNSAKSMVETYEKN